MQEHVFQGMEYVYAVYKEGSFKKAADKLYISQPSISASVKRVEDKIGTALFDRSAKPLRLTQCGEQYIEMVKIILESESDFMRYLSDWSALKLGSLKVGGSGLFSSLILPPFAASFRALYPDVQLEMIENSSNNLEQMLQTGEVDLVVDYEKTNSDNNLESVPLFQEHLILAVPASLPLNESLTKYALSAEQIRKGEESISETEAVPLGAFSEEPFILMKSVYSSRKRAELLCSAWRFHPKALMEFDQQITSYHVSCSGIAPCFVSSTLVRKIGPKPDMVYYKLDEQKSKRNICLFWKSGRYVTRAMEEFQKLCEEK